MEDVEQRLVRICEQGLRAVGYELVELEYTRDQQGWVLRVYIDHPPAGEGAGGGPSAITHADCQRASRQLGDLLDVEDPIDAAYRLEVSSPGVRRPLRWERDFARFAGRRARVEMRDLHEGRRRFVGELRGASGGEIAIDVDGRLYRLPLSGLRRARLEDEL